MYLCICVFNQRERWYILNMCASNECECVSVWTTCNVCSKSVWIRWSFNYVCAQCRYIWITCICMLSISVYIWITCMWVPNQCEYLDALNQFHYLNHLYMWLSINVNIWAISICVLSIRVTMHAPNHFEYMKNLNLCSQSVWMYGSFVYLCSEWVWIYEPFYK